MTASNAPTLPGMPRRLFSATPTRLVAWLRCRRRYRMTYLDRPAPPRGQPWAHSSLGSAVHTALARWWSEPRRDRTPAGAGALVRRVWSPAGFRDPAHSDQWREAAANMVERYAVGLDPDAVPPGVERTVAFRTAGLALSGRVDRIDDRVGTGSEGALIVVDYKTGRRVPDLADARGSLALAVYAVATARTLRRPVAEVQLHHVPSRRVVRWRHSVESVERHLRRAEDVGAELAAAHAAWPDLQQRGPAAIDAAFPPDPGSGCSWCDLRAHCPEGRQVSVALPPWAGIDDDPPSSPDT